MIYWQLFLSFVQVGMFSIGGGYAAMPLIQSQVVEQHAWLTMQEFTDLITIAEMTPGLIFVSLLSYLYRKYKNISLLQNILACLRPVVVALILGAGLSILSTVLFNGNNETLANIDWIGVGSFAIAFYVLRRYKWNPILTMCLCGVAGLVLRLAF